MHANQHFLNGYNAVAEAASTGGDVRALLESLTDCKTQATTDIFSGALSAVLVAFGQVHAAGIRARFPTEAVNQMLAFGPAAITAILAADAMNQSPDLDKKLSALGAIVRDHRHLYTLQPLATDAPPTPTPAPPAPAEPVAVRVVGMPDRETSTKLTYDGEGQITSTATVERDVLPAPL